jgi:hypothetical protein
MERYTLMFLTLEPSTWLSQDLYLPMKLSTTSWWLTPRFDISRIVLRPIASNAAWNAGGTNAAVAMPLISWRYRVRMGWVVIGNSIRSMFIISCETLLCVCVTHELYTTSRGSSPRSGSKRLLNGVLVVTTVSRRVGLCRL